MVGNGNRRVGGRWAGGGGRRRAGPTCEPPAALPTIRERNLRTYAELMRSDIRTQKVALVTETLQLSETDDVIFWPIYRQ